VLENITMLRKNVIDEGLCSGCGTCAGVCPKQAIKFEPSQTYLPIIDMSLCVDCGACYSCCPGKGFDFSQILDEGRKFDSRIGYYLDFFRGNATDATVRKNGASGGMATALAAYALESGLVNFVSSVFMSDEKIEVKIIDSSSSLFKAQKSKYSPVPLNTVIQQMLKTDGKYMVIGTPCQFQGIEMAMKRYPKLKERILFRIGLVCGYVQPQEAIEKTASILSIDNREQWQLLGWRCGEYPGKVVFRNRKTEETKSLTIYQYLNAVPFYSLAKCFLCPDGTNELADVVLGDVHSEGTDENYGIIRTEAGKELMQLAAGTNAIEYHILNKDEALNGGLLGSITDAKRLLVTEQIRLRNKKGRPVPNYPLERIESAEISALKRMVFRRKAHLIEWAIGRRGQKWAHNVSNERFVKRGHWIYTYPNSSIVFRVIMFLRNLLKRSNSDDVSK
jgi:coenzyme F420 hydrogenase subunit beta